MRYRFALVLVSLSISLVGSGCRHDCQFVEMALRTRETELREAREELHRSRMVNEALLQEIESVKRSTPRGAASGKLSTAPALKDIVIGRQSGGVDDDPAPGDEALQVVVEPRDRDGRAVRVQGSLEVAALEVGPKGVRTPLSTWEIPSEQLRRTWKNGLLNTGYFVVVPWKTWPATSKLHVVAKLTLPEGGVFEAGRDVTIRVPKNASRRATPSPPEGTPQPGLDKSDVLPVPRKVDMPDGPELRNKPPQPYSTTSWLRPPAVRLLPPQPASNTQ